MNFRLRWSTVYLVNRTEESHIKDNWGQGKDIKYTKRVKIGQIKGLEFKKALNFSIVTGKLE